MLLPQLVNILFLSHSTFGFHIRGRHQKEVGNLRPAFFCLTSLMSLSLQALPLLCLDSRLLLSVRRSGPHPLFPSLVVLFFVLVLVIIFAFIKAVIIALIPRVQRRQPAVTARAQRRIPKRKQG